MSELEPAGDLDPDVLDELERLARAANPSPHHVYTFPRDDNNWKANAEFHAAAGPEVVLALIDALRSKCTDDVSKDDLGMYDGCYVELRDGTVRGPVARRTDVEPHMRPWLHKSEAWFDNGGYRIQGGQSPWDVVRVVEKGV
jgi:hypothetical protein